MTIVRRNHGKGHTYTDSDTGAKIPGVTTITGDGVPKKALVEWAANTTADYALDHWEELTELPLSARVKKLRGARWESNNAAKAKGTQIHKLAARLVAGEKVVIPDGLEGYVQAYVRFLDDFDVEPILVETTVVSHTHRYCGTLDLLADLLTPGEFTDDGSPARERALLDVKTGGSGIFGETALQVVGYRFADAYVEDDGTEYDMLDVDWAGAVWVRPDGYDLYQLDAGEERYRDFLYTQQMARIVEDSRSWVGEPIMPPTSSMWRLEREL
jgi:hypothetical protein